MVESNGDANLDSTQQLVSLMTSRQALMPRSSCLLGPKSKFKIGSWNVRTLYETGRIQQLVIEMDKYKLDVMCVSETRWINCGKMKLNSGHHIVYSGNKGDAAHHTRGVGVVMTDKTEKCLLAWEAVSERIVTATFRSKVCKLIIVSVYAPTNDASDEEKNEFYESLQSTLNKINRRDIVIVAGDLNAKIGTDNTNKEQVMGKHGTGTISANGELFTEFCLENDLIIGGSLFPHKEIHKYTWVSPNGRTKNQIDHIAVSRKWRSSLLDVRTQRGADINTDHVLLKATLQLKLKRLQDQGERRRRRFDLKRLEEPRVKEEFNIELRNRFELLEGEEDETENLEKNWKNITGIYKGTAEKVLGFRKKENKEWITSQTLDRVKERKEIKSKLLNEKSEREQQTLKEEYQRKDREVKRAARNDKRKYFEDLAAEAEEAHRENNMKHLYEITRKLSGKTTVNSVYGIQDKDGNITTNDEKQMKIWEEYIQEAFKNIEPTEQTTFNENEIEELNMNTNNITKSEIQSALKTLKNGKAAGCDDIPGEILKSDIATTTDILHNLFNQVWAQEQIPEDWRTGLLCKLPKKGDLTRCENWRGITLLSVISKVLTRIMLDRMKLALDRKLRENQAGFRAKRSCTDQIATLRIIVEQSIEWQSSLYLNFIDFQRAFDSVHRGTVWKILKQYGIPDKFINIIKAFYENYQVKIMHNGKLSEKVPVETGVRQGCILSPTIFLTVIDWVMKRVTVRPRGITWKVFESLEDLDFADDLCFLSHKAEHLQTKTDDLVREGNRVGLKVNTKKTKAMRILGRDFQINICNEPVEEVSKFTYLGSIIANDGGALTDVKARIAKASYTFNSLSKIWKSSNITLNTKLRIFNSNVKPVLLYGAETWMTNKTIIHKLQCFINRCLRRILQIFWPERIRNEDLWIQTNQELVEVTVRRRTWRWIGHTFRKADTDISKQAIAWNPAGNRKRGRPKDNWRRHREKEMKDNGKTWPELRRDAQNRIRWRTLVEALCSTRSHRI